MLFQKYNIKSFSIASLYLRLSCFPVYFVVVSWTSLDVSGLSWLDYTLIDLSTTINNLNCKMARKPFARQSSRTTKTTPSVVKPPSKSVVPTLLPKNGSLIRRVPAPSSAIITSTATQIGIRNLCFGTIPVDCKSVLVSDNMVSFSAIKIEKIGIPKVYTVHLTLKTVECSFICTPPSPPPKGIRAKPILVLKLKGVNIFHLIPGITEEGKIQIKRAHGMDSITDLHLDKYISFIIDEAASPGVLSAIRHINPILEEADKLIAFFQLFRRIKEITSALTKNHMVVPRYGNSDLAKALAQETVSEKQVTDEKPSLSSPGKHGRSSGIPNKPQKKNERDARMQKARVKVEKRATQEIPSSSTKSSPSRTSRRKQPLSKDVILPQTQVRSSRRKTAK